MGIKYYESKLNLQWKPILKNILADPVGFVEQGGWDFLDIEVRLGAWGLGVVLLRSGCKGWSRCDRTRLCTVMQHAGGVQHAGCLL